MEHEPSRAPQRPSPEPAADVDAAANRADRAPRDRQTAFNNGVLSGQSHPRERQRTILVADDDPVLVSGISRLLRGAGYACIHARNGEEAVARFLDHHPRIDMLMLDVFMPRLDGVSAWRRMRRVDPGVPCIIMSGGFDPDLARRLQPDGILEKPFGAADLLVTVRDVIGDRAR